MLAKKLTLEVLEDLIQDRLSDSTISFLYEEFKRRGINAHTKELVVTLPPELRPPIIHTLATHVTKEKALFAYSLERSGKASEEQSQSLAACVDMLWLLALILDDTVDKDRQRAGIPSAWAEFGSRLAMTAAKAMFENVLNKLSRDFSPQVARMCSEYVERSLASVRNQRRLTLDSPLEDIVRNYTERSSFHDQLPAKVAFREENARRDLAARGLGAVNRVGQILNDVKDMFPDDRFGRESYSDIRTGIVTVPVKLLWEFLNTPHRRRFNKLFGSGSLSEKDTFFLGSVTVESGLIPHLVGEVLDGYSQFLELVSQVVAREFLLYFEVWHDYKVEQARRIEKLGLLLTEAVMGATTHRRFYHFLLIAHPRGFGNRCQGLL